MSKLLQVLYDRVTALSPEAQDEWAHLWLAELDDALANKKSPLTALDLLNSGRIGLWKDRTDITDSAEYARHLRQQTQNRNPN